MPNRAGHHQLDHTADLALEIWAPTQEELLEEAARAIVEILTEGAPGEATQHRRLTLSALDGADRLVRWMNEILTLAVLEGFLTASAHLDLEGESGLRATLWGRPRAHDRIVTELKSVTYHGLVLTNADGIWRAQVVVDV